MNEKDITAIIFETTNFDCKEPVLTIKVIQGYNKYSAQIFVLSSDLAMVILTPSFKTDALIRRQNHLIRRDFRAPKLTIIDEDDVDASSISDEKV